MRIYNQDTDKKINKITLLLTADEAAELRDSLELILGNPEKHLHEHIPDREGNFKREIAVCIYKIDNLSGFDARSKKLILHDE